MGIVARTRRDPLETSAGSGLEDLTGHDLPVGNSDSVRWRVF
ncbi:hypothetical protein Terro_0270 [Terriglobus roseus DSM 18391]|uniref:Uncharacterized protein n=1 Tax=Terriglobus roseus (strain DSM 18391 / NRRL B-41598 / KBS 63) TaxID=926566 RepID=I3ZBK1_TERRK|nr:hypothetical protein Terro_0270 [Terriglobus roseus DSM 18391]